MLLTFTMMKSTCILELFQIRPAKNVNGKIVERHSLCQFYELETQTTYDWKKKKKMMLQKWEDHIITCAL